MSFSRKIIALPALVALSSAALAHSAAHAEGPMADMIKARHAHMELYAFNLGTLGGMAKGAIPYDAALASTAADSLATLSAMDQSRYWAEGSDEMSADGTRAKAEIWDNMADFNAKGADLTKAAEAMKAVAGSSLEELQAAMGPLAGSCGGCHKPYRAPKN